MIALELLTCLPYRPRHMTRQIYVRIQLPLLLACHLPQSPRPLMQRLHILSRALILPDKVREEHQQSEQRTDDDGSITFEPDHRAVVLIIVGLDGDAVSTGSRHWPWLLLCVHRLRLTWEVVEGCSFQGRSRICSRLGDWGSHDLI